MTLTVPVPGDDDEAPALAQLLASDQRLSVHDLLELRELHAKHRPPIVQHIPIHRPISQ